MIGKLIKNYKILEKINRNAQTSTYKAVDLSLNRQVLVKVLEKDAAQKVEAANNFRREGAVLARLAHSSVPTLHALTEIDGELLMIAEFTEGETLDQIVRREKIAEKRAASISAQILDSLEYAHKNGIFHNNLKSSDIVIGDAGTVKILNFGAFEQNESAALNDKIKNDAQSAVAVIFEMLTGKNFSGAELERLKSEYHNGAKTKSALEKSDVNEKAVGALGDFLRGSKQTINALRAALINSGFDVSGAKNIENSLLNPFTKNDSEKIPPPLQIEELIEDKSFAEVTVSFSDNQKTPLVGDSEVLKSAPDKSSASRYKIAGAAVLVVLVAHFIWQFSFIQNEYLRAAETSAEAAQPVVSSAEANAAPQIAETKNEFSPPPNTIDFAAKSPEITNPETDEDEKTPKPIKIVQPAGKRQTETDRNVKSAPKNKLPRETASERLRRAEKLLTGF